MHLNSARFEGVKLTLILSSVDKWLTKIALKNRKR